MGILFKTRNMGTLDRIIRIATGLALLYIGFVDQEIIGDMTINIIVGIFGIISIVFAYFAFCPIYTLGNISTAKKSS